MFCPHCGKEIGEGHVFCQHCGMSLAQSEPGPLPTTGGRTKTSWEDRQTTGFFTGILTTLKESLFTPSDFFRKMPVTGGLTNPLLFALIIGMVGAMSFYFWQILLKGIMQNFMPPGIMPPAGQQALQDTSLFFNAFFTPFFIIASIFIFSGILHMFLLLVKGARAGFEATFRVVAYGYSANILFLIPGCGSFIAMIWAIALAIIGLREAHEISGGKAAFAVFFPLLCCAGLFILIAVLFMGAFVASFATMMQMYK